MFYRNVFSLNSKREIHAEIKKEYRDWHQKLQRQQLNTFNAFTFCKIQSKSIGDNLTADYQPQLFYAAYCMLLCMFLCNGRISQNRVAHQNSSSLTRQRRSQMYPLIDCDISLNVLNFMFTHTHTAISFLLCLITHMCQIHDITLSLKHSTYNVWWYILKYWFTIWNRIVSMVKSIFTWCIRINTQAINSISMDIVE